MSQDSASDSLTTPPAIEAVFATTELLENILQHLSLRELCRAKLVGKKWNAVIAVSRPLRRILLFLDPVKEYDTVSWKIGPQGFRESIISSSTSAKPGSYQVVTVHPNLNAEVTKTKSGSQFSFVLSKALILSWGASGPWEGMLMTQPPCKTVSLSTGQLTFKSQRVSDAKGVTLGALAVAARKWRLEKGDRIYAFVHGCLEEGSELVQQARKGVKQARG